MSPAARIALSVDNANARAVNPYPVPPQPADAHPAQEAERDIHEVTTEDEDNPPATRVATLQHQRSSCTHMIKHHAQRIPHQQHRTPGSTHHVTEQHLAATARRLTSQQRRATSTCSFGSQQCGTAAARNLASACCLPHERHAESGAPTPTQSRCSLIKEANCISCLLDRHVTQQVYAPPRTAAQVTEIHARILDSYLPLNNQHMVILVDIIFHPYPNN